jgi:SAM-dependent methyltransferase
MCGQAWRRAPLCDIRPEIGFAYIAATRRLSLTSHSGPCHAMVLENGVPLPGPANSLHEEIRQKGQGRFSFWHGYVYFSASDNSDPRTNGRCYHIAYVPLVSRAGAALLRCASKVRACGSSASSTCGCRRPPGHAGGAAPGTFQYVPWQTGLWQRMGLPLAKDSVLLDFGCGEGECVDQFHKAGFTVFGCDLAFPEDPESRLKSYLEAGVIRKIDRDPYRIPFEEDRFDLVFSNQVFEHIMDYDRALAEIGRVLKPHGVGVQIFPGRWKLRESHVYVPFSSMLKAFWWLYFWAWVGIRNEYQAGMTPVEIARRNRLYLTEQTRYLSRSRIREHVLRHFDECRFAEEAYFYPAHDALLRRLSFLLPLYRAWFSATNMRVLLFGKKKLAQSSHET